MKRSITYLSIAVISDEKVKAYITFKAVYTTVCKAAHDFERSVAAASDLKNCTMVNCEYLFRNEWHKNSDDDALKAATEAWLGNQTDDPYFKGIDCLNEK